MPTDCCRIKDFQNQSSSAGRVGQGYILKPTDSNRFRKKYLLSIENPQVNFMSSSISSFEMLDEGVHKGVGVKKIAELYGIQHKHTAAIGDYFNDYEMLKSVYLSACCGQAPKAIHDIVKFEACHCNNGAVADLLNYIMYNYKED